MDNEILQMSQSKHITFKIRFDLKEENKKKQKCCAKKIKTKWIMWYFAIRWALTLAIALYLVFPKGYFFPALQSCIIGAFMTLGRCMTCSDCHL